MYEFKKGTLLKSLKDLSPMYSKTADFEKRFNAGLGYKPLPKGSIVEVIDPETVWIPDMQLYCHNWAKHWFKPANED